MKVGLQKLLSLSMLWCFSHTPSYLCIQDLPVCCFFLCVLAGSLIFDSINPSGMRNNAAAERDEEAEED